MKFKLPLFLWLSSFIAGMFFLVIGLFGDGVLKSLTHAAGHEMHYDHQELLLDAWTLGFRVLGISILLFGGSLFLFRKKLSNLAYTGIFALLMLISLVMASAAATYL